jgi:hypothetical protein
VTTQHPVHVALSPDTDQIAELLRVFAKHLLAAATEIERLATPRAPRPNHDDPDLS